MKILIVVLGLLFPALSTPAVGSTQSGNATNRKLRDREIVTPAPYVRLWKVLLVFGIAVAGVLVLWLIGQVLT